jgi:subtilisin family serine protease
MCVAFSLLTPYFCYSVCIQFRILFKRSPVEVLLLKSVDQNFHAVRKITSVFQCQRDEAATKWIWLFWSARVTASCIFFFLGGFYLSVVPASALDNTHNSHQTKISADVMRTIAGGTKESIRVIIRLKQKPPEAQFTQGSNRKGSRALKRRRFLDQVRQVGTLGFLDEKRNRLVTAQPKGKHRGWRRQTVKIAEPKPLWLANCVAATVRPEDLPEIAARPEVLDILENKVVSIPPMEVNDVPDPEGGLDMWNFSAIGLDRIAGLGLDGNGVRIGIIDTGMIADHPELAGKLAAWAEFGVFGEEIESDPHETHYAGHGTHVASVLAGDSTGIAPGATLIGALALPGGFGSTEQVLAAMEWVLDPDHDPQTDDGAQVVNMSWGVSDLSPVLNEAVESMAAVGVLPVCAIGNLGPGITISPGNAPNAVGVGATNLYYVTPYSGGGDVCWAEEICLTKPDIVAPGHSIVGLGAEGEYQARSGTSFAAPHVAGAAALLLQANSEITLPQLRGFLLNTAADRGAVGPDVRYGRGQLDIASAFDFVDRYALRIETKDLVLETVEPSGNGRIHFYRTYFSTGEGWGEEPLTLEVPCESDACHTLGLTDVDGDGYSDLVVSQTESLGPAGYRHLVNVYRVLDAGGFSAKAQTWYRYTSVSPDPPDVIGLADVNGDLRSDLVLHVNDSSNWYYENSTIHVCLSNGQDSFEPQEPEWAVFDYNDLFKFNFWLGDQNDDGRADLVYGKRYNFATVPVYYYFNQSSGNSFEPRYSPAMISFSSFYGQPLRLLNSADVNGDGFDDLILSGEVVPPAVKTPVYVGLSQGAGSPGAFFWDQVWSDIALQSGDNVATLADVDGDGAADLIAKTAGVNPQIEVWLSNGWDQFEKSVDDWFDSTTISSTPDFQIVGVANMGLGNWH